MSFFQEQDIDPMLAQLGETVTIGAVTAKAIVRVPDEEILAQGEGTAPLIGRSIELIAHTGTFPVVTPGTQVTRGAETYRIHSPLQTRDGAVVRLLCEVG